MPPQHSLRGYNKASKQKVGHCDKTTLQIFFIFTILNTYVSLIFHAKIQPKIFSGSGEEVDFVVLVIFSSPGQSPGRAIVLPPTPASALAKC